MSISVYVYWWCVIEYDLYKENIMSNPMSLLPIFYAMTFRNWKEYITNLVCYTYFHWFLNPECQHITGELNARYYNKTGYSLGGRTLVLRGYRNGDKYLYFLYVAKNLIKNNVWYDFSADENACETQPRYFFFLSRGQILGHDIQIMRKTEIHFRLDFL